MFAIWTSLGLQFEFGKAEFKDRDEMRKVEKKWLRVRPALSQGGVAEVGTWGWSPRQFHPIATARLDEGEAQKESKGRKPRMDKLYTPGSFNSGSESRLELTGHLHLGRQLCRLHPQPPCTSFPLWGAALPLTPHTGNPASFPPPGPAAWRTAPFAPEEEAQLCPSLSSPLSSHSAASTVTGTQLPSAGLRFMTMHGDGVAVTSTPGRQGTVMCGSDRQTHLGWSGRDHWERGQRNKRASFSVPIKLRVTCATCYFSSALLF